jgi:hypothetical protein
MSAIPFDYEPRQRAEQIGFLAIRGQILHRLIDQEMRLFARAFRPEQREEGFLARPRVLAQRLAGGFLVALGIEAPPARLKFLWCRPRCLRAVRPKQASRERAGIEAPPSPRKFS